MLTALKKGPTEFIVEPEKKSGIKPSLEGSPVHHKEAEDRQMEVELGMKR